MRPCGRDEAIKRFRWNAGFCARISAVSLSVDRRADMCVCVQWAGMLRNMFYFIFAF